MISIAKEFYIIQMEVFLKVNSKIASQFNQVKTSLSF
jgi:hypothetical protein